jgi:Domain of unknown function (DUF6443)/A nuclease of the HNH/ENDO VII superfamily with conserved LHH
MKKILTLIFLFFRATTFSQDIATPKDTTIFKTLIPSPDGKGSYNQQFPFLNTVPPSPEAASLGRYGEIPVSKATGTASFDILIHEIISGSLRLPIKLSNHTSGIKVSDIASTVGTGWALIAGGNISRVIKGGLWDECTYGFLNQTIPETTDLANFKCFLGNLNSTKDYVDGNADDFFYNFQDYSGKFLFNNRTTANTNISPKAVTYPNTTLKIEWVNTLNFKITDNDGIVYLFENKETTNLSQSARTNPCSANYTSSWYLTKIISANKVDEITFVYTSPVAITGSQIWSTTLTKEVNSYGHKDFKDNYAFQRSNISSIFLSEILFKNGKVTFTYANDREDQSDADAKRLTTISILKKATSTTYSEVKHFTLNHSYFTCADGYSQVDNPFNNISYHQNSPLLKRLRLDSVVESAPSPSTETFPPYSFEYYEDHPLPIFGSMAQDYWGYSNGVATNKNLLLWYTDPTRTEEPSETYGANCNPNIDYSKSGMLKKVTYPTKGDTQFFYEANKKDTFYGGGHRISKTINTPITSPATQLSYNYITPYFTNGIFEFGNINDKLYNFTIRVRAEDQTTVNSVCVDHFITTYPEKVNVSLGSEPTVIAYEEVDEYREDGNGNRLGKKKSIFQTSIDPTYVDFPTETQSASWKRGQLLREKTYSILPNNTEVLIQEQQNIYTETLADTKTRGYQVRISFDNDVYSGTLACAFIGNLYCDKYSEHNEYVYAEINDQSSVFLPTQSISTTYDQYGSNPVISTTTNQFSTVNQQLIKSTTHKSNGALLETYTKYPHDFVGNTVYDEMVNRHIFSPTIEKSTFENSVQTHSERTNYKLWYDATTYGGVQGFFAPISVEEKIGTGLWFTKLMMGESLSNPTINGFDNQAKPILYTLGDGLVTTITYYTTDGKIDLLKTQTIDGLGASNLAQLSEFDYKPLVGLTSLKAINGYTSTFQYNALNQFQSAKDANENLVKDVKYHFKDQSNPTNIDATPTQAMNYILSRTARTNQTGAELSSSEDNSTTQIQYLDGLGAPLQSLIYKGSPDKTKDIVNSTSIYNNYGQEIKSILPTPSSLNTGEYISTAESLAGTFYGDLWAFNENVFENSMLNRLSQQYNPGLDLRGTTPTPKKYFYETAGTDIPLYTISGNTIVKGTAFYPANSLFKTRMVDEAGNETIEIKDIEGKLIQASTKLDANTYATTHYIYNELDQLKAIIQPQGYPLTANLAYSADHIFFYNYDNRGRKIEVKVPAAGLEYLVYDRWNRLVMSQTAMQRTSNKWTFTKYDALNRAILMGEMVTTTTHAQLQTDAMADTGHHETYNDTAPIYYGYATAFPTLDLATDVIYHINFYDTYGGWASGLGFLSGEISHTQANAKGLLTGSKVLNQVTANTWLKTAIYYDFKGRKIQIQKEQHKATEPDITSFEYTFAGEVLFTKTNHKKPGNVLLKEMHTNTFDHLGRTIINNHSIDDRPTNIANYTNDKIGRLKTKYINAQNGAETKLNGDWSAPQIWKNNQLPATNSLVKILNNVTIPAGYKAYAKDVEFKVGANLTMGLNSYLNLAPGTSSPYLQKIDFDYHVRGGILGINLDAGTPSTALENDLFSYKLDYQTDNNIKKQSWKNSNSTEDRSWDYAYNGASWLTSATYAPAGTYTLSGLTFDKNGNIKTLVRNGIDDLKYDYTGTGNRLNYVEDVAANVAGFKDNAGGGTNADYTYWDDGSLKSDKNKGIYQIDYDTYLKKVCKISFNTGGTEFVKFFYSGDGTLIRRESSIANNKWDYTEGLIYKNDIPYQMNTVEGRAVYNGTDWEYEFEYRDHLGNLRVAFKNVANVPTITQTAENDAFGLGIPALSSSYASASKFLFQKQELIEDFGLNLNWFKYRPFDPAIGKGWQPDRLAEKYDYNSPYAFSENKVTGHVELDGLEAMPSSILLTEASAQWEAAKMAGNKLANQAENLLGKILSYTDFNDATVLVTSATRGGNAINLDGTNATTSDKVIAGAGALLPLIAGSFVKKVVDKIGDGFSDAFKINIDDANKIDRSLLNPPAKPGNAPTLKSDGSSIEIHHEGQNANGPFKEMTKSDHRLGDNYKVNHPSGQTPLTKEERKVFNKAKIEYWKFEYPKY